MPSILSVLVALVVVVIATGYLAYGRSSSSSTSPVPSEPEPGAKDKGTEPPPPSSPPKPAAKKTKKKTRPPPRGHNRKLPSDPRFVRRFGGHAGTILAVSVSPDGQWVVTSGADGQVRATAVNKDRAVGGGGTAEASVSARVEDHDVVHALSWDADSRTVACALRRREEVRFYRIRRKKDAGGGGGFPYELAELVKRRFSTSSKLDVVGACVVDRSHSNFSLVLTSGESAAAAAVAPGGASHAQRTTVAWNGGAGHAGEVVGGALTGGGEVRLSDDGKFLCGRGGDASTRQVKVFEVHRKRVKGEPDPVYDTIPHKAVMTLVADARVADVVFCYRGEQPRECDRAAVICFDGTVLLWNLDVEYRLREDPKLLCTAKVLGETEIVAASSSFADDRIAVASRDGSLHVLTCTSTPKNGPSVSLDFTIEGCHAEGIADVQFGPLGNMVYTLGIDSKDVYAWRV